MRVCANPYALLAYATGRSAWSCRKCGEQLPFHRMLMLSSVRTVGGARANTELYRDIAIAGMSPRQRYADGWERTFGKRRAAR